MRGSVLHDEAGVVPGADRERSSGLRVLNAERAASRGAGCGHIQLNKTLGAAVWSNTSPYFYLSPLSDSMVVFRPGF